MKLSQSSERGKLRGVGADRSGPLRDFTFFTLNAYQLLRIEASIHEAQSSHGYVSWKPTYLGNSSSGTRTRDL